MARGKNEELWDRWRERLRRFDSGNLTVAAFCEQDEVSQAAFYAWRKKLPAETRQPTVDRSHGNIASATTRAPRHPEASSFIPVVSLNSQSRVVLTLTNGVRVEVPGDDRDLVAHTVRVAGTMGGAS